MCKICVDSERNLPFIGMTFYFSAIIKAIFVFFVLSQKTTLNR